MTVCNIITAQCVSLIIAFFLDLIFGDPDFPLHPIRLIGRVIWLFEKLFRFVFPKTEAGEKIAGFFMALFTIIVCGGIPFVILHFAYGYNMILGIAIEAIICYFMLSARSLAKASKGVYNALSSGDTETARKRVSMIVGRDTDSLDETGIAKAAVETVAENTSDGVIAPLFYMAIGGAVLGCIYKAINTMDSMVGYKSKKYINFGAFAARLDDVVNYIPSRIAAALMIISAKLLGYDAHNALVIFTRDSRNHASPNSGQTESAVAGALRVQLGGDAYYFGELYKKPTIGDDYHNVTYTDILRANRMMYVTAFLAAVIFIAAKFGSQYLIIYLQNIIQAMF
ncbi:MAG: cobalamin biosynthesis protein CobD [Clostridia bacterium]|nr:cobalamin biosynthesis protein CobD [Clostridia bacterium]MBQ6531154.1 cobalamin biosynthesis protein CobD [Clostridia bacterium]